ncbi:PREDICTED: CMRF35-like molecule 9 isoform X4 [Myotis davidii]|uniref:CMRF35-like molecule 9 isoform X4 n=1 Tax=Myotis davidii TaxID=225400 RepID=UPI000767CDE4|nr:PREDICTED: CMRF35-like molecule 9 isoform X4 [Myotis davidii]
MGPLVLLWGCLLLPGYEALMGPKNIRGFEGDTVSLQCTYEEKLREHKKYWCKKGGILVPRCSGIIYAGEDGQERTEGRVSIQDNPQKLLFNVTLRELTQQDSGEYWCGINILGIDQTSLVSLLVLPGTSPNEEPPLHRATSPHAGTSRPSTYLDSTSTEDPMSRASPSKAHILAPVLVLLVLLLAAGLAVVGRCVLRCRKEVQLDTETQNEKVHLSHLNHQAPEYAVVNLTASPGPRASPKPSASPYTEIPEIRRQSQALEEGWRQAWLLPGRERVNCLWVLVRSWGEGQEATGAGGSLKGRGRV